MTDKLAALLDSNDPTVRRVAAYGLRQLNQQLPAATTEKLGRLVRQSDAADRVYLVSAAYLAESDAQQVERLKAQLTEVARLPAVPQSARCARRSPNGGPTTTSRC